MHESGEEQVDADYYEAEDIKQDPARVPVDLRRSIAVVKLSQPAHDEPQKENYNYLLKFYYHH